MGDTVSETVVRRLPSKRSEVTGAPEKLLMGGRCIFLYETTVPPEDLGQSLVRDLPGPVKKGLDRTLELSSRETSSHSGPIPSPTIDSKGGRWRFVYVWIGGSLSVSTIFET